MICHKLGLGTVQFGLDYGVSNLTGCVSEKTVGRLLIKAADNGVTLLDTAATYGKSEAILGQVIPRGKVAFRVVTKTPVVAEDTVTAEHGKMLETVLHDSLKRLGQERVYGLLVHHAVDLLKPGGRHLLEALRRCKDAGLVSKIGVSVYCAAEIDGILDVFTPDIIQLPISVADQRLIQSGHITELKNKGVEIHARSLFLQGLLLMDIEMLPEYFAPVKHHFQTIHGAFTEQGWSPLEGCLRFGLEQTELDIVLVGVVSIHELEDILGVAQRCNYYGSSFASEALAFQSEKYLNPVMWRVSR